MKVALVTTPAASSSRVAAHARTLLPHLRERADVELFVEPGREGVDGATSDGLARRPADELLPREFDQIVYCAGNEAEHGFMARMIRALGGTVLLHDWGLAELARAAWPRLAQGGARGFATALREGGLAQARAWRRGFDAGARDAPWLALELNRSVVRFGDAFLVHSRDLKLRILRERNALTPVGILAWPIAVAAAECERESARRELALEDDWRGAFVVLGLLERGGEARAVALCEGVARARAHVPSIRLALVGARAHELAPQRPGEASRALGELDARATAAWVCAADLCALPGRPASGGSAGPIHAVLARGRGVLVPGDGEQAELPSTCVLAVPPGADEAARIAARLVSLALDRGAGATLERAAREYVARECAPERVARALVECLENFPRARAARRSLIALRLEMARDRRRAGE